MDFSNLSVKKAPYSAVLLAFHPTSLRGLRVCDFVFTRYRGVQGTRVGRETASAYTSAYFVR